MGSSKALARWDIVTVPFPCSDQLAEKHRPALVISDDYLFHSFGLVWVMMITSAKNPRWKCDVVIPGLEQSGLPVPSVVRPAKVAAIEPSRIARRLGKLPSSASRAVEMQLQKILG